MTVKKLPLEQPDMSHLGVDHDAIRALASVLEETGLTEVEICEGSAVCAWYGPPRLWPRPMPRLAPCLTPPRRIKRKRRRTPPRRMTLRLMQITRAQ